MIAELFLVVALAPRPMSIAHADTPGAIGAYHLMKSEEERLRNWLRKNNPGADIFIHHNPQEGKLKNAGWERVPFTWRGNKIWIQRKPKSDQKMRQILAAA